MAENIFPPDNALAFMKADLGYFNTTIPSELESYFAGLVFTAGQRIRKLGIKLEPGNADDDQLVGAYAAWLYRNKSGQAIPESLRREILDRQVHKATSE